MRAKAGQGYLGEAERWFNYMERSFKCGIGFEWPTVRDRDLSVETAWALRAASIFARHVRSSSCPRTAPFATKLGDA